MHTNEMIAALDVKISRLKEVRALLIGSEADEKPKSRKGRPKGSTNKIAKVEPTPAPTKRKMSAEGIARIAEAQRARWAAKKKASKTAKTVTSAKKITKVKAIPAESKKVPAAKKVAVVKRAYKRAVKPEATEPVVTL